MGDQEQGALPRRAAGVGCLLVHKAGKRAGGVLARSLRLRLRSAVLNFLTQILGTGGCLLALSSHGIYCAPPAGAWSSTRAASCCCPRGWTAACASFRWTESSEHWGLWKLRWGLAND